MLLAHDWDEVAEGTLHGCHNAVRSSSPDHAKTIRSEIETGELLPGKTPPPGLDDNEDEPILGWDENGMNVFDGCNVVVWSSLNRHAESGRPVRETEEVQRKGAWKAKTDENKQESEDEDVLLVGEYDAEAEEEEKPFVLPLLATDRGGNTGQVSHF